MWLQVGQQPLTHGRVLGGAFPHAQGVFWAGDSDAQRDDDAVGPHVHAVEQQHGEVELGERGGPPGVELCLRLGHEPPTHRTLARAPGANVRAQRLDIGGKPIRNPFTPKRKSQETTYLLV